MSPPVRNKAPNARTPLHPRAAPGGERLILNRQRVHPVNIGAVKTFMRQFVQHMGKDAASLSVVFIDDAAMQTYNCKYRGYDKPTDVLSFCGEEDYLGDILISVETAFRQARSSRVLTLESNLRRLLLHGFLHLCGYDHETDNGEMRVVERRLRRTFQC